MAILQIKGTRQEVVQLLELLDSLHTGSIYEVEDQIELSLQTHCSENITSSVKTHCAWETDEAGHIISEMLTNIYND